MACQDVAIAKIVAPKASATSAATETEAVVPKVPAPKAMLAKAVPSKALPAKALPPKVVTAKALPSGKLVAPKAVPASQTTLATPKAIVAPKAPTPKAAKAAAVAAVVPLTQNAESPATPKLKGCMRAPSTPLAAVPAQLKIGDSRCSLHSAKTLSDMDRAASTAADTPSAPTSPVRPVQLALSPRLQPPPFTPPAETSGDEFAAWVMSLPSTDPLRRQLYARYSRAGGSPSTAPEAAAAFSKATAPEKQQLFKAWLADGCSFESVTVRLREQTQQLTRADNRCKYMTKKQMLESGHFGGMDKIDLICARKKRQGHPHWRPHPELPDDADMTEYYVYQETSGLDRRDFVSSIDASSEGPLVADQVSTLQRVLTRSLPSMPSEVGGFATGSVGSMLQLDNAGPGPNPKDPKKGGPRKNQGKGDDKEDLPKKKKKEKLDVTKVQVRHTFACSLWL